MKIKFNEDKKKVKKIQKELKANNGYCPCSPMQIPETKCMCKEFREQNYEGECHCGLYVKVSE
jgi:hypothetical protein